MKLFSYSRVVELSKLAQVISIIKQELDWMSENDDETKIGDYYSLAYMCRVGILDRVERNGWHLPNLRVYTNINGVSRNLLYPEAHAMTVGRLLIKLSDWPDEKEQNEVINILAKEKEFYDWDKVLRPRLKEDIHKILFN